MKLGFSKLGILTSIAIVGVSSSFLVSGCSTAKKVKTTLALNDIHIQAAIAEEQGDDARAHELWSEFVDRRPQSALAEYRLGKVETRMGQYEQAIGHLRVAHDLQPGNIEYLEALADTLVLSNRIDSLMTLLRQTLNEGEPGSGYLRLAKYAQQVGQMDEARESLLLSITQSKGTSALPYLNMANFARSIKDEKLETQYLRYALWFDRADPTVLSRLNELGLIPGPSLALPPEF